MKVYEGRVRDYVARNIIEDLKGELKARLPRHILTCLEHFEDLKGELKVAVR